MSKNAFDYSNIVNFLPVFEETAEDRAYVGDFVVYSLKGSDVVTIGQLIAGRHHNPNTIISVDGHDVGERQYRYVDGGQEREVFNTVWFNRINDFNFIKPLRYFPAVGEDTKQFLSVAKRAEYFIGSYISGYTVDGNSIFMKVVSYEFDAATGVVRLGYPAVVNGQDEVAYFDFKFDEEILVSYNHPYAKKDAE
jgi:hypothetical protein